MDTADKTRPLIQSIVADINEVGFRWELCNLDGVLFDRNRAEVSVEGIDGEIVSLPPPTHAQRRWEVLGRISHFEGCCMPDEDYFYMKPRGFASADPAERARALWELAEIMDEWTPKYRMDNDTLGRLKALVSTLNSAILRTLEPALAIFERKVAETYMIAFKDVYDRAPILPRATYFPL